MTAPSIPGNEVTTLLVAWNDGDSAALNQLMPLVYNELRKMARHHLSRERPEHTLQTTDLVHEAYFRLVDQRRVQWQNRAHFFGIAAQLMRRILVDRARHRGRLKRGAGKQVLELDQAAFLSRQVDSEMIAIDEALTDLATLDQRKARVVELRFFGGLSVEETANVLSVSEITVMREWKMAKAWLHRALSS